MTFDIQTPGRTGMIGLTADATLPKRQRGAMLTQAVEVLGEGTAGLRDFGARWPSDPLNGLLLKSDPAKFAPRGSAASWTFAAPAAKRGQGARFEVLRKHGTTDTDFLPVDAKAADFGYGGIVPGNTAALLVESSGHDDHETLAFAPGGPLVADHESVAPGAFSRWVWGMETGGEGIDASRGSGLHDVLRVRGMATDLCPGKTGVPGAARANSLYLNATKSAGTLTGWLPATFATHDALLSHEKRGPLRPATDLHALGRSWEARTLVPGALDCDALWTRGDPAYDAPLEIEDVEEPQVGEGTFPLRVHIQYDSGVKHQGPCGERKGLRRLHVKVPVALKPSCTPTKMPVITGPGDANGNPTRTHESAPSVIAMAAFEGTGLRFRPRPDILKGVYAYA